MCEIDSSCQRWDVGSRDSLLRILGVVLEVFINSLPSLTTSTLSRPCPMSCSQIPSSLPTVRPPSVVEKAIVVWLGVLYLLAIILALMLWWLGRRRRREQDLLPMIPISTAPMTTNCSCSPVWGCSRKSDGKVGEAMGTPPSSEISSEWDNSTGTTSRSHHLPIPGPSGTQPP